MTDRRPVPRRADTPADQLAPLDAALGDDCPEIWRTIAECIFIGLAAAAGRPADPQQCVALTVAACDVLRAELGGTQPYLSKSRYELSGRDRSFYERYTGRNLDALAALAGVTTRRMRDIIAAGRAEDLARRQGRLDI